jgi:outer membrane protein assembly factor BamB
MKLLPLLTACLGLAAALAASARAADWPHFLGPRHDCRVAKADAVGFWGEGGLKREWEYPKGKGWASPTVADERVLLFHRSGTQEVLDCLELDSGRRIWRVAYEAPYRDRYGSGDGARSSPVIGGGRVWIFGITGVMHCVDLKSGGVLWKKDLGSEYSMRDNFFGHGSSPLLLDGRIIVPVGGTEDRCVVALEAESGRQLWIAKHSWGAGYASAVPLGLQAGAGARPAVLVFTGGETRPPTGGLLCIDAGSGDVLGEASHRSRIAESVNAASPVIVSPGRVFTTEGYGSGGVLHEIAPDGSIKQVWSTSRLGSQFGTPIEKNGMILGFDGQNPRLAQLVCLDASSGRENWSDDLGGKFGRGSLLDLGEQGVVALGESGELVRFFAEADKPRIVQREQLFEAAETWSIPVLAGRRLLVMQNERSRDGGAPRLICYRY